jgi:signal transduction histidine kinase
VKRKHGFLIAVVLGAAAVAGTSAMLQTVSLGADAKTASEKATAFNERFLRQLGADLHDGPAQLVAFAALRLGSRILRDGAAPKEARDRELKTIRTSLADAMEEIRAISAGLALPHIETASLGEVLAAAVKAHERRTKTDVRLSSSANLAALDPAVKICAFRFVQEGLANAFRHAGGKCGRDPLLGPSFDSITVRDVGGVPNGAARVVA